MRTPVGWLRNQSIRPEIGERDAKSRQEVETPHRTDGIERQFLVSKFVNQVAEPVEASTLDVVYSPTAKVAQA